MIKANLSVDGILSKVEYLKALKEMKSGKSPGTDGLPVEIYQNFRNEILEPLLAALNYGFATGNLSTAQRRGIIEIIPKKSEELFYVRNWRPLTLFNCDYKIAAKAIASRIKIYLPKLVNNDQTGFMKGRRIFENTRLIDSVINYTSSKNIVVLLLCLAFEKAFDTLEWPFIEKTPFPFNFDPSIIQCFKTFYNCSESCIVNNGWISSFLPVNRGLRQGCPLSPRPFTFSVEILARSIRKNTDIKGLHVKNTEIKITQYADDTSLDGSRKSLIEALNVPRSFSKISGLRLNSKKTEALWIGSCKGRQEKLCSEEKFNWKNSKIKALGVWLSTGPQTTTNTNFSEKKNQKLRNCLGCWSLRRLSLIGKITVLNCLATSKIINLDTTPIQPQNY